MKNYKLNLDIEIKILIIVALFLAMAVNVKAITDNNSLNNQMSVNITVIETQDLTLFFTSINEIEDRDIAIGRNIDFINRTYPLSDVGLKIVKDKKSASGPDALSSNEAEAQEQLNTIRINVLSRLVFSSFLQRATNAVAIVEADYLLPVDGATGLNYDLGGADVILVDEMQMKTVAHEVGHTLELCDEYRISSWRSQNRTLANIGGCPNGDLDGDLDLDFECYDDGSGCPANTFQELFAPYGDSAGGLRNFMGGSDPPNFATTPPTNFESWISEDSYVALLNRTNVQSGYNLQKISLLESTGDIIVFRVNVFKDGTIDFLNTYILEGGFVHNSSLFQGTSSIEVLATNGSVITSINFDPSFKISTENGTELETNISFVSFSLPLNGEFPSHIIFKNTTDNLSIQNVTLNAPIINLTYPLGGEVIGNKFNITWNAADTDGDDIYYAVLVSEDNGSNYTALDLDLNQTYYEINPDDYDQTKNYVIKVLATDGINTGSNTTNVFNFGVVTLNITSLQTLYSNDVNRIFEFVVINDGNSDVRNIYWQFDTGDNLLINSTQNISLLTPMESAFVFIAHNYSSLGEHTINASAIGEGSSLYSLSTQTIVGDLSISDFNVSTTGKSAVFFATLYNDGDNEIANANWSLESGELNVSSGSLMNLGVEESVFIIAGYDYSSHSQYTATLNAIAGQPIDEGSLQVDLRGIILESISLLNGSGSAKIFELIIENPQLVNLIGANWSLDTTNNNFLNSTTVFVLAPNEQIFAYIGYNFTSSGTFNVNATARNGTLADSEVLSVVVP